MRRLSLALALVALLGSTAWAANLWHSSGTAGVSVSAVNSVIAFTDVASSATFNATTVLVRSRSTSPNTCFLRLGGTPSTTAYIRIAPGESLTFSYSNRTGGDGWANASAICAAAETATWDVVANR